MIAREVYEERKGELRIRDVVTALRNKMGICTYNSKVSVLLKNDLKLSYRRARPVNILVNKDKNLILRQLSVLKLIDCIKRKYRIVNMDETLWNGLNFKSRQWKGKNEPSTSSIQTTFTPTCLVAAIDTDGLAYGLLHQGSTNSNTTIYFIK